MKIKADNRGRVALGKLFPGEDLAHGEWDVQVNGEVITLSQAGQTPEVEYETPDTLEARHIGKVVSVTFQSRHEGENRRVIGVLNAILYGPERPDQVVLSGEFLDLTNSVILEIKVYS